MADLLTNTGQAAIAYQDALNQARNTANMLLRQYGFVKPNASGDYTTEEAQNAFDPNKLFDLATGGLNQAALGEAVKGLSVGAGGTIGGLYKGGADVAAEQLTAARASGLRGGGLAAQRRKLAQAQTAGQVGQAKTSFLSSIAQGLAPIGGAWQGLQTARTQDELARQLALAQQGTMWTSGF